MEGYDGEEGLDKLLAKKEIEAILVLLPIQVMLQVNYTGLRNQIDLSN